MVVIDLLFDFQEVIVTIFDRVRGVVLSVWYAMLVDDFGLGFDGEMGRDDIVVKGWLLPYLFILSVKFVYLND